MDDNLFRVLVLVALGVIALGSILDELYWTRVVGSLRAIQYELERLRQGIMDRESNP